jgi:hypothetical protein
MTEKSFSWSELADFTHEKQVAEFGFCTCEDNEGKPNPYEDCPKPCLCGEPEKKGWHNFDPLAAAQNKATEEVAGWIAHIYFTKSEKVFNDLMETIANEEFKGSYARLCDGQA